MHLYQYQVLFKDFGRSGRRGQPAEMLFFFKEENSKENLNFYEMIDFEFLRCIAIIELYLKEKWIETFDKNILPFSLLYHQTMSYLFGVGGCKPNELASQILTLTPFKCIEKNDYKLLLRYLLKKEQLEQDEDGNLLIGLKGEGKVNNFDFFSVFSTAIEYSVRDGHQEIGTVQTLYTVGQRFSLAGFTWQVIDVNEEKRQLFVKKIRGTSKISWSDDGEYYINTKIMKKIRQILIEDEEYRYLDENGLEKLKDARSISRRANILKEKIFRCNEKVYYIFPWMGTKQMLALKYSLEQFDIDAKIKYNKGVPIFISITTEMNIDEVKEILKKIKVTKIDKFKLDIPDTVEKVSKYNYFVPRELLKKQFIEDVIDIDGMQENL